MTSGAQDKASRANGSLRGFGRVVAAAILLALAVVRTVGAAYSFARGRVLVGLWLLVMATAFVGIARVAIRRRISMRVLLLGGGALITALGGLWLFDAAVSVHTRLADSRTAEIVFGSLTAGLGLSWAVIGAVTTRRSEKLPTRVAEVVASFPVAGPRRRYWNTTLVLEDGRVISGVRVVVGGYIARRRGRERFDARSVVSAQPLDE